MSEKVEESIKKANKEGLSEMEKRRARTTIKVAKAIEDMEKRDKARGRKRLTEEE